MLGHVRSVKMSNEKIPFEVFKERLAPGTLFKSHQEVQELIDDLTNKYGMPCRTHKSQTVENYNNKVKNKMNTQFLLPSSSLIVFKYNNAFHTHVYVICYK